MASVANILFYFSITCFVIGVLANFGYLLSLWKNIPRRGRWAVATWLVLLAGLTQWIGRSSLVSGIASIDASAYLQIASTMIAAFVILLVYRKSYRSYNFKLPLLLLFLYGASGFITAPLSDVATISAFKAAAVMLAVLVAVLSIKSLADINKPGLLYEPTYIYFTVISFLAVVGGVFFPEITHRPNKGVFGYMLEGWPALNSNSLSYVSAVVLVISLNRFFKKQLLRRRILYLGACSVGAVTLLLAQGRTSIISTTLAIIFMSFYIKRMRPFRSIIIFGALVILSVSTITGSLGDWVDSVAIYLQRGVTDEDIATLSGRTNAWNISWQLFLDSPVSGYGFYAAGKTLLAPHNAYFTVLLNVGLLGFIPWVIAIISGMLTIFSQILKRHWNSVNEENDRYKEVIAAMIVQFIRTITGQDLTVHSYSTLLFLSALVYIYVRKTALTANAIKQRISSQI